MFALMRELQVRRQMTNVKGDHGKALVRAADIAKAFERWMDEWRGNIPGAASRGHRP